MAAAPPAGAKTGTDPGYGQGRISPGLGTQPTNPATQLGPSAPAMRPIDGSQPTPPPSLQRSGPSAARPGSSRERLAAAATHGTAGLNEFDQARGQIDQARQNAIAGMTSDAALIHGGGTLSSLAGLINEPAQRQEDALTAAGAEFNTQQHGMNDALDRYVWESAVAKNNMLAEVAAKAAAAKGGGSGGSRGGSRGGSSGQFGKMTATQIGKTLLDAASQNRQSNLASLAKQIATYRQGASILGEPQNVPATASGNSPVRPPSGRPYSESVMGEAAPGPFRSQEQAQERQRQAWYDTQAANYLQQQLTGKLGAGAGTIPGMPQATGAAPDPFQARIAAIAGLQSHTGALASQLSKTPLYPDARDIGVRAGLDPLLVNSIVGPTQEATYKGAEARLQKLENPAASATTAPLSRQVTDAAVAAAQQLHKSDKSFPSDAASVKSMLGITIEVPETDSTGAVVRNKAGVDANGNPVEGTPRYLRQSLISSVLTSLNTALGTGLPLETAVTRAKALPLYKQYPQVFNLAFAMAGGNAPGGPSGGSSVLAPITSPSQNLTFNP